MRIQYRNASPSAMCSLVIATFCGWRPWGAGAWRLDGEVGSLTPGKRADIPIVDLRQPHLDGVGDPVFAMLMRAAPADVHTVIVDGEVLKSEGRLVGDIVESAQARLRCSRDKLGRP